MPSIVCCCVVCVCLSVKSKDWTDCVWYVVKFPRCSLIFGGFVEDTPDHGSVLVTTDDLSTNMYIYIYNMI